MSILSLPYQQNVLKRYHSDKQTFRPYRSSYLQDGRKNQYGTILRHCHPMYWTLRGVVFVLRLRL